MCRHANEVEGVGSDAVAAIEIPRELIAECDSCIRVWISGRPNACRFSICGIEPNGRIVCTAVVIQVGDRAPRTIGVIASAVYEDGERAACLQVCNRADIARGGAIVCD